MKKAPVSVGLAFFLIHIAIVLHVIPLSRYVVIADRYIYIACIGLSFIVAWYFVRFTASRKGVVRKIAIGCFACITLSMIVYSNIRCRDWKDTGSIKKEIRDLLENRKDYVPSPEVKQLKKGVKGVGHVTDAKDKNGEKPEFFIEEEYIKEKRHILC